MPAGDTPAGPAAAGLPRGLRATIPAMTPTTPPASLPYTGDPEADALLATDPLALLVGFALDQQVTVQKAFAGPLELRRRIGTLDAAAIAAMDPEVLQNAFRERPALHRFPGAMASRVQELCRVIARDFGGDAARVWREVPDAADLEARLRALPGIGEMKAKTLVGVLGRRFGVRPSGWEAAAPSYPTLADVDSAAALVRYQEQKRAMKTSQRAVKRA
jgi:uncharacterized HhH-GPD family protein